MLRKEREAEIREYLATGYWGDDTSDSIRELLAEIDALRAELADEQRARCDSNGNTWEDYRERLAQAREDGRREGAEQERARARAFGERLGDGLCLGCANNTIGAHDHTCALRAR